MPSSPHTHNEKKEGHTVHSISERDGHLQNDTDEALDWEEVEVDIGWGTLRGKARGTGPHLMLGLHGWLDNANTFDLVAGVLPDSVRFVSLDLPGHGLSDHFPAGYVYDPRGYVGAVKRAVIGLGWQQFTLFGHSIGAVVSIMYTAIFPEDVHALISIDIVKTWSYPSEKQASEMKKYFYQYFDNERKSSHPPLVYTEEELLKKTIEGSRSLDEKGARILLKRGSRQSEDGVGLILRRDLRAKTYFIGFNSLDVWLETARAITCPVLLIKAREGHQYETEKGYQDMLKAFEQDCKHYCYYEIPGKHHIHLTHPIAVRKYLLDFLLRCTDVGNVSSNDNAGVV